MSRFEMKEIEGKMKNFKCDERIKKLEAEKKMGFPDNRTRILWRGKPEEQCPDGPRYKACGIACA